MCVIFLFKNVIEINVNFGRWTLVLKMLKNAFFSQFAVIDFVGGCHYQSRENGNAESSFNKSASFFATFQALFFTLDKTYRPNMILIKTIIIRYVHY